ncbi:DNA binding methylated-DNA--cysteine S-methyltransferase [Biscogniauxia mediterranea]|nr:DNA binding methylated-DNA--cysteine S-methyltransferase [Biscogniauxia mediterranea]
MPRTDEASAFYYAVYSAVREIPHGRVTTYGHIARLVGTPQRARQVGTCLKYLPRRADTVNDDNQNHNNNNNDATVPWQRVINAKGAISPRSQPSGAQSQADALQAEGVAVTRGSLGELLVDLDQYGWFPPRLPSEEAEGGGGGGGGSDDDDDDGNE